MKKLLKKAAILCLAVIQAIAVAALASCGTQYTAEIDWNVDLNNPITIKMLFPDSGMSGFGTDRTAQLIEKATGYKAEYGQITDANADNEINNILSTQEKWHTIKLSQAQYDPYVASGTWLDLTDLLTKTESGKILYDLIDLLPNAWDSVTYTDESGKTGIYAIPECGYVTMEDYALVWNKEHLKAIGWYNNHTDVPQSLTEVTDALQQLQDKYGSDTNYHALGLGGSNSSNVENIMAAFGCANQFYIDEQGQVQLYIYDESAENYVKYMNTLRQKGIISDSWQSSSSADICSKFAKEYNSCVYLTYWWVSPLCKTIVSNELGTKYGLDNDYQTAHDELIAWNTRVRGDGSYGSEVQETAKHIGGDAGNAYYISIPYYMASDAVYVIDYLSKKLQSYALWYGGEEGVDWNEVTMPEDGQENYSENIIYMQPWSYTVNGTTKTGGGKWIQLTDSYIDNIVDNSMYASGSNVVEARSLFHLRETGFDAWPVAVATDDTIILDPIALHPTFKWWSPISILSRTTAKRGIATAIDAKSDAAAALNITRLSLKEKSAKKNGVTYYYWSDNISGEMTQWYNTYKKA